MTEQLTREEYSEHVGAVFRIALDGDSVLDLTLVEVSGLGPQTTKIAIEAGRPAPFSVVFRGPAEPILPQAMYRFSETPLGELDLFIVPLGPGGEGIQYEAVYT